MKTEPKSRKANFYHFLCSITFMFIFALWGPFDAANQNSIVAIGLCMVWWWISECIPMAPASLLPLALLPALTGAPLSQIATAYADPVIFLFLGGFILAISVEKHQIHRLIALWMIRRLDSGAGGLLLALMLSTFILSMWVSNTATALVMLPIAVSSVGRFGELYSSCLNQKQHYTLGTMSVLGIAYAANVGGMATLIGTPPNAIFAGMVNAKYGINVDFLSWFVVGFPVALLLLIAGFLLLYFPLRSIIIPTGLRSSEPEETLKLNDTQKRVLWIFAGVCLLWIFGRYFNALLPVAVFSDTTVAVAGAIMLFVPYGNKPVLLDGEDIKKIPWGILLLFGGSLCIAGALEKSGVVELIGEKSAVFSTMQPWMMMFLCTGAMLFLTEFIGSTAITTMMLPLVLSLQGSLPQDGLYLALPVVLAASGSFMLPTGTPPNAVIFASGYITVGTMMRMGIVMNVMAWLLIALLAHLLLPLLLYLV